MSVVRDVKPAFVVQRQEGPFEKEVIKYGKKKIAEGKYETTKEIVKKTFSHGYMVVFPKGHSVFIESEEELFRLGFAGDPSLIDMETGDVVGALGIPGMTMPMKTKTGSQPKLVLKANSSDESK